MNSNDLLNDLLRKLYIEDSTGLSGVILDGLLEDCVSAANRAFQTLWTAPEDFFRRNHFTFPTVIGTGEYTLDQTIQSVLGPIKLDDTTPHLRQVASRGDFDNYASRFLGADSNTVADARPQAYFIERTGQVAADSTVVKMFFTPKPDAVYTVDFEGSTEAPSFTLAELQTPITLPVPHQYIESIFLPVARHYVTRSHYFMANERQAELSLFNQDFAAAMSQLGFSDPKEENQSTSEN